MPDVFERFFGHFGREPSEFYELERLDPHYRVFWKDGDKVDVLPDREANKALFEEYEPGAGEAFEAYLEESERTYEIGMEHFVYEDRPRLRDYVDDKDVLRYSWGSRSRQDAGTRRGLLRPPEAPAADAVHPRLPRWLPDEHPALYNLMSHVDYNMGVYYPEGGIGAVVDGIVELGEDLGVEFVTDAEVTAIEGRRGASRSTPPTASATTDLVVSDADYAHTEQELLPETQAPVQRRVLGVADVRALRVPAVPRRGRRAEPRTPHAGVADGVEPPLRADIRRPSVAR